MAAVAPPNTSISTKPPSSSSSPFQSRTALLHRFTIPLVSNPRKRHRLHISNVLSDSKPTATYSPPPPAPFISRYAPDQPRKGSDVLVEALEREAVTDVFAYPGGASMEIHQALTRPQIIRNVLPRHEQGGIFAAEGYARASGLPGVCIATSGPNCPRRRLVELEERGEWIAYLRFDPLCLMCTKKYILHCRRYNW